MFGFFHWYPSLWNTQRMLLKKIIKITHRELVPDKLSIHVFEANSSVHVSFFINQTGTQKPLDYARISAKTSHVQTPANATQQKLRYIAAQTEESSKHGTSVRNKSPPSRVKKQDKVGKPSYFIQTLCFLQQQPCTTSPWCLSLQVDNQVNHYVQNSKCCWCAQDSCNAQLGMLYGSTPVSNNKNQASAPQKFYPLSVPPALESRYELKASPCIAASDHK